MRKLILLMAVALAAMAVAATTVAARDGSDENGQAACTAPTAGVVPYVRRRARDGWTARDLVPSVPATALALAAGAVALLLPPLSAASLAPAAVAVLAGAGVSFRAGRRYRVRTP